MTTLSDSGAGSLRAAFPALAASGGTNICFGVTGTITLSSTIQIGIPVTITDPGGVTISGNNLNQIFFVNLQSPTFSVQINGLILTAGYGTDGGALDVQQGTVTLVGTTITKSTAIYGGGVYNQGTLTLNKCVISDNTAMPTGDSGANGGGISNQVGATLNLQSSVVSNNVTTYYYGGGVYNSGLLNVTLGSFTGNQAYIGGAIYIDTSGTLSDTQGTLFTNNTASQDGGAIDNYGNATVSQALFTANQAQGSGESPGCGGAVCNWETATIKESTLAGNTSSGTGGAIETFGDLTLGNDTISGNTAAVDGSGLEISTSASILIENTIIAGNTAGVTNPDCNLCAAAYTVGDLIGVTANLGPLANNGGPTQTMMPLPGGAAVGAGVPSATADQFDQRGFSRTSGVYYAPIVDVGAVQSHYSSVAFSTQPSNTTVSETIFPPVAVQVIETDNSTTNYPQGVPVTISLLDATGNSTPGLSGTLVQSPTVNAGVTAALFPDLSVASAGSYKLFATDAVSTNSSSADPTYNSTSNLFQVTNPVVVTLAWSPAPVTYGPMPLSEFNASATINGVPSTGTFVYTFTGTSNTINVGQIYPVATYQVQVTYTPTGSTNNYTLGTALQINQATPVLSWATPAAIFTSTPLSNTQLNATATGVISGALPGNFVYNPAAGAKLSAGQQTLHVTFTPADTTDYTAAIAQVPIQVNPPTAASVAIQGSANPIVFGQSETLTAVVTGNDGNPFSGGTASFTSDGTAIGSAAVVNGSASIVASGLTGGAHQIGVSYTNPSLSQPLTASIGLTVNKATPTLSWQTPAPIYTSTPLSATQLNATAFGVSDNSLGGSFLYNPAAGTTLAAGSDVLKVTFTPTDATDYNTANAQVTIQVNTPTAGTITLQESSNPITFGQSETFTAVVNGSDGKPYSGGTATFTADGTALGSVALVNGSASVVAASLKAGTHPVAVSYTNSGLEQPLTASASLTVNKATPVLTWPTPSPIYTSTTLSGTQLDASAAGVTGTALAGTFLYSPAAGATLPAGSDILKVTFTPTDTTDYTAASTQVTILVNAPAASTVAIQESANPITFGQSETFTAVVNGSDGKPFSGGTATFTVDGIAIGSSAVINGTSSIATASLTGGSHQIGVSYTNSSLSQPLTASVGLTVNKATPVLTWVTPSPIYTSTPLSGTQLNAVAAGINGASLAGVFVYNPAAGSTLSAGSHTLSVTFTPTDTADYKTANAQVTIQVNTPTAGTIALQESSNPITFGQSETLTAVVNGSDGKPYSGGTATFTADGITIGSVALVNGSASVVATSLKAGTHPVAVSYTNSGVEQPLTASAILTVNKATPALTWPTPAPIYTSTSLSATQLDASAAGVTGTPLVGTFVYNPAAGATLSTGPHLLNVTFTPTDLTDYAVATAQVTIQVNTPTAGTLALQESANPITFGQSETFTVVVKGSDGNPYSGGTATLTVDGTIIGSIAVVNGSGSVTAASLSAGTHQVAATYTNPTLEQPLTSSATLTINKATPLLSWATPASINTVTPLSATQLDATATGITGAPLPGAFVYNPAAGATLSQGSHTLSATFTPTDAANYISATVSVTIQVGFSPISITSISPSSVPLGTTPESIMFTGTGFTSTSMVELNGSPLATSVTNSTTLVATIPAANLAKAGSLSLTVFDPTSKSTSNAITLTVTAPTADVTLSVPSTTTSGEQPTVSITLNSPYPIDLTGTLTLTFSPSGTGGVDDPAVQFSSGGRTFTFSVPAGSTTTPTVALQTGTVAGTITVTLTFIAGGVDVTPSGLLPSVIHIDPSVPVITSVSFTNSSTGLITVVINGFSNTREVSDANFIFTGRGTGSLNMSKVDVRAATGMFTEYYNSSKSDAFGSEFTYTQQFQLSRPDSTVTGVSVTLTNSVGTSGSVDSQ